MKKIDYVVISSDDNPLYKDYYPVIASQWKKLGFKTYYINISDEDRLEKNEWGIYHKIKRLDFVSPGFQSQVVRLFSCNLVDNVNLLMSDIDMLPLNKNYFENNSLDLNNDNIVLYSGQPYSDVPFYPMCYVLVNSDNLKKILNIENLSFHTYCEKLFETYGEKWNTDENFLYDKVKLLDKDKVILKSRDFSNRIDRSNWRYDLTLLKKDFYIDSHLLRPFSSYQQQINTLLSNLL